MMNGIEQYQAAGIAITIDGLVRARDLIQQEIDELSAQLAGLRGIKRKKGKQREGEEPAFKWEKRQSNGSIKGPASYWAKLSPEGRSAEMRRRMAVAARKAAERERETDGHFHISDPRNPKHEAWLKRMKNQRKRAWNAKTAAEKEAWKLKMAAGKKKRDKVKKQSARQYLNGAAKAQAAQGAAA